MPTITGFNIITSNIGKINNKGFEAGLTYKVIDNKDFKWSSTFNFWANTNKIVTLTGIDANGDGIEDDLVSSGLFIGKSIQAIFDYKADGITNVSVVMGLKKNGKLIGYHVEYFQKALSLSDHKTGQISELSYLTKNLDYAETDTDHMAQFIELGSLQ